MGGWGRDEAGVEGVRLVFSLSLRRKQRESSTLSLVLMNIEPAMRKRSISGDKADLLVLSL